MQVINTYRNNIEILARNKRAMEYLSRKASQKKEKRDKRIENAFMGILTLGAILFMIACFMIAAARGAIVWGI
jgi:voltage-gated potassium channel Kch